MTELLKIQETKHKEKLATLEKEWTLKLEHKQAEIDSLNELMQGYAMGSSSSPAGDGKASQEKVKKLQK